MIQVKCQYVRTVYPAPGQRSNSGFMVVEYHALEQEALHEQIYGRLFTATGTALPTQNGLYFTLGGNWEYQAKYKNYALQVEEHALHIPNEKGAILNYLSSLPMIGDRNALLIYQTFGLRAMEVVENEPELLCKVRNIPTPALREIIQHFQMLHMTKELTRFLMDYKFPPKTIEQIYLAFREKALDIARANPYLLTVVKGIGYQTIDPVARMKGIALDSTPRIESAAICALEDDGREGHVFSKPDRLSSAVYRLLNVEQEFVPSAHINKAINQMIVKGKAQFQQGIYLNSRLQAEDDSARLICMLLRRPLYTKPAGSMEAMIQSACTKHGMVPANQQKKAIEMALQNSISIVTGGPGTGKTTVLQLIVDVLLASGYTQDSIALAAPTGRAARKIMEATGHPASTIHRLLGMNEEGEMVGSETLSGIRYLIIDEASMVDIDMLHHILSALPNCSGLLFVGDAQQLPSVGPGDVLRNLIESTLLPVTRLDVIYRQSEDSLIVFNADKIARGRTDLQFGTDFKLVVTHSAGETEHKVLEAFQQAGKAVGYANVQVLCPVWHSEKGVGVHRLNDALQNAVNPARGGAEYSSRTRQFRTGDRVMQLENDDYFGLSNGDIGIITEIVRHPEKSRQVRIAVQFEGQEPGSRIYYDSDNIDKLTLSYAITIHKSQGSEFHTVIIPMLSCYHRMLQRNLIYTAVTRGKQKVVLIGDAAAVQRAIETTMLGKRNTALIKRLHYYHSLAEQAA